MRRPRILQWAVASLIIGVVLAGLGGGCTEPPLGYPYAGRNQALPGLAFDASGLVDSGVGPAQLPGLCVPQGSICHENIECCNSTCDTKVGVCGALLPGALGPVCSPDGIVCMNSSDCCDGYCGQSMGSGSSSGASVAPSGPSVLGICGATPSPVCAPQGILCHDTMQCCNAASEGAPGVTCNLISPGQPKVCGTQVGPSALCVPFGVTCLENKDCCVGVCTLNTDNELVCDIPP
jgi:hypothetical protein